MMTKICLPLLLGLHTLLEATAALMSCAALLLLWAPAHGAGTTTRVSVSADGTEGNSASAYPALSADGRYVAFGSAASNLVADDTNGSFDIFVRDNQNGSVARVSVDSLGGQANGRSLASAISADGRYVAFVSFASNLVPNDTNGVSDIFVHDRESGATARVSVNSDGSQGNHYSNDVAVSANGRYVAFASNASNLVSNDTNGARDIFVHDREAGTTRRITVANRDSNYSPALSADGRYIAFSSASTNLIAGDTNGTSDIFVHDIETDVTTRVSVSSDGAEGNDGSYHPSLSADGRYVSFTSFAKNLVEGDSFGSNIYVHDRQMGTTKRITSSFPWRYPYAEQSAISADGRYVAFGAIDGGAVIAGTSVTYGVLLSDVQTGDTILVSASSAGAEASGWSCKFENYGRCPAISADGRTVAFSSRANNLVVSDTNGTSDIDSDVFLHEWSPTLSIMKVGNGTGLVTSIPEGIDCGSRCGAGFEKNNPITLSALADAGYNFGGWSGPEDCADGVVALAEDLLTCTARFVPTVTVTAKDATATESRLSTAELAFTRTGDNSAPLTVHFRIGGSATAGSDYQTLGSSITFPSGSGKVLTKIVSPIADGTVESDETVVLELLPNEAYAIGADGTATVYISDDFPEVTVSASDNTATEAGPSDGEFAFTRTGSIAAPLTVFYDDVSPRDWGDTFSSDWPPLGRSITFPAGVATVTKLITPLDDQVAEEIEPAVIALRSTDQYRIGNPSTASIDVLSDDLPRIAVAATAATTSEIRPANTKFVVTRTNGTNYTLRININVRGTATMGQDYWAFNKELTFHPGMPSVELQINAYDDQLVEPTESVIVELPSSPNYVIEGANRATINIVSDDSQRVSITAIDTIATEQGRATGKFKLVRSGSLDAPLRVYFKAGGTAIAGKDYASLGRSTVFPAGVRTMIGTVVPIDDTLREPKERVVLQLLPNSAYTLETVKAASVTIVSNE